MLIPSRRAATFTGWRISFRLASPSSTLSPNTQARPTLENILIGILYFFEGKFIIMIWRRKSLEISGLSGGICWKTQRLPVLWEGWLAKRCLDCWKRPLSGLHYSGSYGATLSRRDFICMPHLEVLLDKRELLELLNIDQPARETWESMVQRYSENSGAVPADEVHLLWLVEVSRWLRYSVDDWLQTGLNADGSESPRMKDLFRTRQAVLAVHKYADEHAAAVSFSPLVSEPIITIGEPHKYLEEWNAFFLEARKEADRYFTSLMASDWRQSICQCRFAPCSRYFLLDKPRRCYRYGTFCCKKHQNSGTSEAYLRQRRIQAKDELIEVAAKLLLKWRVDKPDWHTDTTRKHRLAAELSLHVSERRLHNYLQETGVGWVTRHQMLIEQRRAALGTDRLEDLELKQARESQARVGRAQKSLRWKPRLTDDQRHFIYVLS